MPRIDLKDRVLVITGASSGIGEATARKAVEAGYRVALTARSIDKLRALAEELGGDDHALAIHCDVREWDDQQAAVKTVLDTWGRLDVAFANAGFGCERGFLASTPEFWKDMILTNVYGCALTIRATLPALKEAQGHCLITSSTAGRRVLPGSIYSASKWAVTAMGEALRQEVTEAGVRVTLIEPGMTDTPFFENEVPEWSLKADDIANGVMYALEQPRHVAVTELLIRPTGQAF